MRILRIAQLVYRQSGQGNEATSCCSSAATATSESAAPQLTSAATTCRNPELEIYV
jgi:hypothetical protein